MIPWSTAIWPKYRRLIIQCNSLSKKGIPRLNLLTCAIHWALQWPKTDPFQVCFLAKDHPGVYTLPSGTWQQSQWAEQMQGYTKPPHRYLQNTPQSNYSMTKPTISHSEDVLQTKKEMESIRVSAISLHISRSGVIFIHICETGFLQPKGDSIQDGGPCTTIMRARGVHRIISVECSTFSRQLTRVLWNQWRVESKT